MNSAVLADVSAIRLEQAPVDCPSPLPAALLARADEVIE